MSSENLTHLIRDSHFNSATASMTPLAKSYLHTYLNLDTNMPVLSEFVESAVAVTQTAQGRKLAQTTLANLEKAAWSLNSMKEQSERAKHDLYLLVLHPNGGNALFNSFHKEESITAIGLKIDDPTIDKIAKEVEATKKAAAAANKKNPGSASAHRGRGTVRGSHKPNFSRTSYASRDSYNHGGSYQHNHQRGSHHGFRGGRGGFNPGAPYGSFQHNPIPNGQGQQSGQNNFPPKPMIGWFGQG